MSTGPAQRHLLRLLELAADEPPAADDLECRAAAQPERLAAGLVDEAFANDDVTDGDGARVFIDERLAEFAGLVSLATRTRVAGIAAAMIDERAPS